MSRSGPQWDLRTRPVVTLVGCFILWKSLLLLVAYAAPGSGYDSSTTLVSHARPPAEEVELAHSTCCGLTTLGEKLTRWDAIYFIAVAQRGYRYEQEWAFGWGFTTMLAILSRGWRLARVKLWSGQEALDGTEAAIVVGIWLAHAAHLVSVLLLYKLSQVVIEPSLGPLVPLVAALLHIISPAGVFLSAPYTESLYSCLSFLGYLFYAWSLQAHQARQGLRRDVSVLMAGLIFGLATTIRSNGLFNGLPLLYDALWILWRVAHLQSVEFARLATLGVSGALVAAGFVVPQWLAYDVYCIGWSQTSASFPPWCTRLLPSIYTWVQDHYWHVGFLRYWTMGNLPLFVLAAPMLAIMSVVAMRGIQGTLLSAMATSWDLPSSTGSPARRVSRDILRRLSMPQLLVAALALTSFHVQVITRLSSGYPVWYWWLASAVCTRQRIKVGGWEWDISKWTVRWMVMYAVVQGGLFASFLPPA
ncbi:MAG: ER membrane glycoprotein subunit of the GPI transamidase complex-like protein [Thelocarpon superellum]|nr:MAG: ER membrane glycoprotein subunit of the GPI transamidase complex-like protein [Thelocarpon superellum]